ncbi:HAD family hydrolase [Nitrincola sp. MINF-07-Sa-05]|uniref:HAD family hydrolase n=1 Tax=Nitrincola salilacus TaxID=3400273 RepID=UPI00391804BD
MAITLQGSSVKLRAILFDHDGTLVNSEPIHYEMWVQVLRTYGLSLSEQQYKAYYAGVPTNTNAIDLVQRFGIDVSPAQLAEAKNSATRDYLAKKAFPLMQGVPEAISSFHNAGLKLAVVTGASANGVHTTLQTNEFTHYFSTIVSGDDVRASKPAPDCYLMALERLGITADECLAIEDTQHGLEAAYSAGIKCLALPTEMSKHHDFELATAVLDGMSEAVEYVRQTLHP